MDCLNCGLKNVAEVFTGEVKGAPVRGSLANFCRQCGADLRPYHEKIKEKIYRRPHYKEMFFKLEFIVLKAASDKEDRRSEESHLGIVNSVEEFGDIVSRYRDSKDILLLSVIDTETGIAIDDLPINNARLRRIDGIAAQHAA